MSVITNEVSWSRKRKNALGGCPRRYFYQYYLKWDGWLEDAAPERRLAYRLSQMTSLPKLAGIAVHETIRRLIAATGARRSLTMPAEDLAAAIMRRTWIDAKLRRWQDRPKVHPPVFELYYQDGVPREEIVRFGAIARRAVRTFADSDVFKRIAASDPASWMAIDEPMRFGDVPTPLVDESRVWCRPDFAMRHEDRVTIYDWKTGLRKDADRLQLYAYALHAWHQWRFPPEKISCVAVYLSDHAEEASFPITAETLEETLATIRSDIAKMRELDALSHDAEQFPADPKPAVCAWCEFQEICPAVKRAPVHLVGLGSVRRRLSAGAGRVKLRELVTDEKIKTNLKGREHLPIWDAELSEDDLAKLRDQAYLDKLGDEHREFQAYNLARYANAKYEPKALAKRLAIPETHVWAYWALFGSRGTGLYS